MINIITVGSFVCVRGSQARGISNAFEENGKSRRLEGGRTYRSLPLPSDLAHKARLRNLRDVLYHSSPTHRGISSSGILFCHRLGSHCIRDSFSTPSLWRILGSDRACRRQLSSQGTGILR